MFGPRSVLTLSFFLVAACSDAPTPEAPSTAQPTAHRASASSADTNPEDVAIAFFEAVRADDLASVESLFTEKAQAGMSSGSGFEVNSEDLGEFEVGAAILEDGLAKVPVVAELEGTEQELRLLMRRESERWRIFGFDVSIGGEGWMTLDFEGMGEMMEEMMSGMATEMAGAIEDAFSDWSQGGSKEEIARNRERFDSLRAISPEEHEAAWQVDLVASDRSAFSLATELVHGTGVAIDTAEHADAFEQVVTVELRGVSRLEALEHVCARIGVRPIYPEATIGDNAMLVALTEGVTSAVSSSLPGAPDAEPRNIPSQPTITFEAGDRTYPVSFAGPFLIEVEDVTENVPTTTGSLLLVVRALGLAQESLAFQTEMAELLRVEGVEGKGSQNLNADDGVSFLGTPQVVGSYLASRTSIDLKGLLAGVESIQTVHGRVRFQIPVSVTNARCDAGTQSFTAGSYGIAAVDWDTYTTFEITMDEGDAEAVDVRVSPIGPGGELMGTLMTDSMPWDDVVRASLQTPAAPAAVDLKICRTVEREHEFEIQGIPLLRFAEQPAKLAELEFDGEAPFAVEFVRFAEKDAEFPEVELTITNLSNKDAERVLVDFQYVDASGADLESFQHTLTGTFGPGGVEPFTAGAEQSQKTTAFFMPDRTASVRVRVTQVDFVDASSWSAED